MKLLFFGFCLLLAGCASQSHSHVKTDQDFRSAIQQVLEARNNIRQIISHVPTTAAELAGPANGNPNAMIFNVADYAQRLQSISLTDCPEDFRAAFKTYVAAWRERAAQTPDLEILNNPGASAPAAGSTSGAVRTEAAWQAVLAVSANYPPKTEAPF